AMERVEPPARALGERPPRHAPARVGGARRIEARAPRQQILREPRALRAPAHPVAVGPRRPEARARGRPRRARTERPHHRERRERERGPERPPPRAESPAHPLTPTRSWRAAC